MESVGTFPNHSCAACKSVCEAHKPTGDAHTQALSCSFVKRDPSPSHSFKK